MLLSFFILSALACFWWGYTQTHSKKKSLWVWSLFYLCLAGGFMTKGPIGLIFPCGILFFFLLFERKLSFLLKMWIPLGIFIFIAVVGSWLWGAYIQAW
jgi:4-amino-4-deoxy-L-arabinose transferase-like glycosyltransferase